MNSGRCRALACAAVAMLIALPVMHAQTAADSAARARAFMRAASAANAAGDLDSAMRSLTGAMQAWPTQPAYARSMALLAARRGDGAALVSAIDRLAALEAGDGIGRDSAVLRMAERSDVSAALAHWRRATAQRANSTVFTTLSDSTLFPEGMDIDPRSGTLYVASVRHGIITERKSDGTERRLPVGSSARVGAVLAVRVDTARGVLWATTSAIPQWAGFSRADSALAFLLRVRLSDGTLERMYALPPASGGRTLGDVAVSSRGDVLLSDSQQSTLFLLRNGADALIAFTDPLFRSLQGIAPTIDGTGAYVADYSHGLLHVDLGTGHVTRLADAPGTTALGIDGIVLRGRDIIAVQNGMVPSRIAKFTLDSSGRRILRVVTIDRHGATADEPTIGTLLGDSFLYVANSQWEKYDTRGARNGVATLSPPIILRVPLTAAHGKATIPTRPRDLLHLRARDLLRRALRGGSRVAGR